MKATKKLTQERLKELLHYNPETGLFTWRMRRGGTARKGSIAGGIEPSGYLKICIENKIYRSHRLAWLYVHGYFPEHEIDHRDRDRSNNKINNLREASHQCNSLNHSKRCDNLSGVTGVWWDNGNKKWAAYISISSKRKWLGRFKSKLKAVQARWDAEVKHGFPNCCTSSESYKYLQNRNGSV